MTTPAIICCAYPFGYGPAAKLILIARRLRDLGFAPIFVGDAISHELAARSDVFADVIRAGHADPAARARIASASAVFSMMDRELSRIAVQESTPLYVADSLHWQRESIPEPFERAERYWVQSFDEHPEARGPRPGARTVPVGPIVEPRRAPLEDQRRRLVITLGGYDSPHGADTSYCDFVMHGLLRSALVEQFAGSAILLAGKQCADHLNATFRQDRIEVASVSHELALTLLDSAAKVITSPGLTTTLECFQLGVPTCFLPPQNYSQWRTLRSLQARGLCGGAFAWWDVMESPSSIEAAPELERTPMVRQTIAHASQTDRAKQLFAEGLQRWGQADQRELGARQRELFEALGPNGADRIARELGAALGKVVA